ncbi:MAG: Na+/Ca+ antiporter, CaCA family [Parcubacteria group bacterium GW2011_GWA2_43_17]|nr:MAG: Na+/Ca+ antiporter, CaCA family [Parcubacteria group bacterium GW2011_GWA2_43_17]KKT92969.1 MAG: Na+/Ca+ antiporter, CaCA family [Parcubacteria group bacterium GW2011_GWF2_45_11]OGY94787.1 MAG: sodium:proton exchanger [Candidatus Komeilibacteria bacterium RIFOXYC2_FULL_45_12]HAH04651.1 sodium:proton exchanger [Candidatus Komeilibacteria bacterium]HBR13097.1 sodium:proton exchanger [Candidatus Komeilibacteria bacterium]
MLTYILFIIGFIALIKGADLLVNGASAIAKKLKVSDLVIGLTVVAFGTSMPELFVNIFASLSGNSAIAIGNILGSNIANILLILGVSAIIFPLKVTKGTVWKEIPMSLLAALLMGVMANDYLIDQINNNALTRTDGLALIAFFIIFLYYTFGIAKNETNTDSVSVNKNYGLFKSVWLILLGLAGLVIGGQWIVNGAIAIAGLLGVSQSLIGLTIVAVGTSLPELATSAMAAYRKNADIAVGNIVGSNIFNIFWILGLSSIIKPLPFQPTNNLDIGMTIFSTFLLFLWMFVGKKRILQRWQGLSFISLYTGYIIFLILQDKL